MSNSKKQIPRWFWILSAILLLWNIMGVFSFFSHTFITEEALSTLSEAERNLYGEYPLWTKIIFAIAVFGGLLGCIGLLLRKKWAKLAFVISLCAIIPQMIFNVFFTTSIDVFGLVNAAAMPVLVIVLGIFSIWFADSASRKNWLH